MRRVSVVVAIVLLVGFLPTAAGQSFDDPPHSTAADRVVLTAELDGSADARWRVAYHYRLPNDTERSAFEGLRSEVEANDSTYARRLRDTVDGLSPESGVDTHNLTVDATRTNASHGVVTYRFRWQDFLGYTNGTIEVTESLSGLSLDERTSLTVVVDRSYGIQSAAPPPANRTNTTVTWRGPVSFGTDEPALVLENRRPPQRDAHPSILWPFLLIGGSALFVAVVIAGTVLVAIRGQFTD